MRPWVVWKLSFIVVPSGCCCQVVHRICWASPRKRSREICQWLWSCSQLKTACFCLGCIGCDHTLGLGKGIWVDVICTLKERERKTFFFVAILDFKVETREGRATRMQELRPLTPQATVSSRTAYTHIGTWEEIHSFIFTFITAIKLVSSTKWCLALLSLWLLKPKSVWGTVALILWVGVLINRTHFPLRWQRCSSNGLCVALAKSGWLLSHPSTVPQRTLNSGLGNYPPGTVGKSN